MAAFEIPDAGPGSAGISVLESLFARHYGTTPDDVQPLPQSGSSRRYFRLSAPGISAIGAIGTSAEEDRAFVTIAERLKANGVNVPEVYEVSNDLMCYLQEDLGGMSLYDLVSEGRSGGRYSERETALLLKTVRALPHIQIEGGKGLDWDVCYPQREFDRRMVAFDQNYFKYCFLKPSGVEFNEVRLDDEFHRMADILLESGSEDFLYRDFQARNVMFRNGEPWFIDFQGGRRGPVFYDLASFVWQARAGYGGELRRDMVNAYLEELSSYRAVDRTAFLYTLRHFVLFRTLQVLGAYGFRGLVERKSHFIESIPYAMDNLRSLLEQPFVEYPYLSSILRQLTGLKRFAHPKKAATPSDGCLTVRVYSFSYKKGIPDDISGNGGGFVFDCRALANPGRYEYYRRFNGRDPEVIRFIEDDGGVAPFLDNAYTLCDAHVAKFIERGFTDMMISFGCTGGQHRSVYCAEKTARHIAHRFGVKVHLIHREMNIKEYL